MNQEIEKLAKTFAADVAKCVKKSIMDAVGGSSEPKAEKAPKAPKAEAAPGEPRVKRKYTRKAKPETAEAAPTPTETTSEIAV